MGAHLKNEKASKERRKKRKSAFSKLAAENRSLKDKLRKLLLLIKKNAILALKEDSKMKFARKHVPLAKTKTKTTFGLAKKKTWEKKGLLGRANHVLKAKKKLMKALKKKKSKKGPKMNSHHKPKSAPNQMMSKKKSK